MEYQDIFKDKHLHLPKEMPKKETYRSYVASLFNCYLDLLGKVNKTPIKISGLTPPTRISSKIDIQKEFTEGLLDCIDLYYDGQPSSAYLKFVKTLENRKERYKKILNVGEFELNESFYRIRKKEENYALGALEMFHIPFEMRGQVQTQRYSIPGFPSLYLAKTLYVAWEELKRPSLNSFQAVRLSTKEKITYLDLTSTACGPNYLNKTAYKYLMTWPLIAACSIRVRNPNDTFKPEYIIPQLLLQWVRNSGEIDAIKYSSTNIEVKGLRAKGDLYNIVLPVKENKDSGYCTDLANKFQMTQTVSKQLLDLSGGLNDGYVKEDLELIDAKVPSLEIIKGKKYPYSFSALGQLELFLDKMITKAIDC